MDFLDEECFEDEVEEQIKEEGLKGAVLSKEVKNHNKAEGEDDTHSFLEYLRSNAKQEENDKKEDMINILDFEKKGN